MRIKLFLSICAITIFNLALFGQGNEIWTAFWNEDSTLIGYQDNEGNIKIPPKFTSFSIANKFESIIAVLEIKDEKWTGYYLTKTGKIIGEDSLYVFDNGFDCENEGFIRFKDRKTDKVGMYNRLGNIVIPADYNDLTKVRNGMIVALKDAEKKYWEGGEHYSWLGGKEMLIDTSNNILVENFPEDALINFFTLKKTKKLPTDTTRKSFLAVDGTYYSFIDFEKEFSQWFTNDLLVDLTQKKLIDAAYDNIIWQSKNNWSISKKESFVRNNFLTLKKGLLEILEPDCDYFIMKEGLNPFMFEGVEFEKYFNNCGESKDWIFPTMTIVISHTKERERSQNHYKFLCTEKGYKLIKVTIRNDVIK